MRSWIESTTQGLGLLAVACTLALSLPGIRAVRADEETSRPPVDASFEGFERHRTGGDRDAVIETAGPTCNAGAQNPIAVEMAHRRAIARMQAQLMAEARARGAAADREGVVVLNGSGYNYRPGSEVQPTVAPPAPAPSPAEPPAP